MVKLHYGKKNSVVPQKIDYKNPCDNQSVNNLFIYHWYLAAMKTVKN